MAELTLASCQVNRSSHGVIRQQFGQKSRIALAELNLGACENAERVARAFSSNRSMGTAIALALVQLRSTKQFFVAQASLATVPTILDVAPYAAFGALYFLVSAALLIFANARRSA
jgi:hypothetical protein